MSNNNEKPLHLGTRQCDRFPSALSKDYVKIDERSFNDLIQQMSEYAKKVNFYNDDNPDKPDGNWEPFFKEIYDYETQSIKLRTLQKQMNEGTVPPHLSLLLSFLKLYQIEQNNLNRLTERHLEFYYKNVLGFTPKVGRVGNAVVFVSPVKNTSSVIIPKGTLFDAGKDSKGKTIMFESTDEVTINKAQVNDCYFSHRFDNGNYDIETLQVQSRKQDSADTNSNDTRRKTINLNFGFAIAISSFLEAKNQKYIDLGSLGEKIDLRYFTVEYTSVNGWEEINDKLFVCLKNLTDEKSKEFSKLVNKILPELKTKKGIVEITSKSIENLLSGSESKKETRSEKKNDQLLAEGRHNRGETRHYILKINAITNPMVPYDPKLHGEGYNTNNPIIRFLPTEDQKECSINTTKNELWRVLEINHKCFNQIYLHEDESTDNLIIENKYGMVNNVAGSSPFGYLCQKNDYFLVKINIPNREFYSNNPNETYTLNLDINEFHPNKDNCHYLPDLEFPVFQYSLIDDDYRMDKRINEYLKKSGSGSGFTSTSNPYTPIELKKAISYNSDIQIPPQKIELFTIAPWGINKIDLQDSNKSGAESNNNADTYIFQDDKFPPLTYIEGEEESGIFIAISGISQPTCLNLYFELGSYNTNKQKITWSYLSKENKWKEFNRINICKDGTDNFSRNGIVQLYLSEEVFHTKDNIPADKIWLYVSTRKSDESESKLDDFLHNIRYIQTQAVEVTFSEESVGTLQNEICLPQGSITKLIKSITGIKKVEQPFDGFVGIASETTDEFNCRVSEKLRHKGKAWTSWDYERILLEKFPQLAAVKCISPSTKDNKYPGKIKLVVFPNVSLIPQSDISKPQIDAFTRNEIENYLKTICSPFVKIEIHNPSYNPLKITGKLTLRKEYHDHAYYLKLIEEALLNYLAPWRSDPLKFSLITQVPTDLDIQYFLEKLEYVDYIKELSIESNAKSTNDLTVITSSNQNEITIE